MSKYRKEFFCGLEKESLRIRSDGSLDCTPHPKHLGSKLTHPEITTDFAEMQIEYTTPVYDSHEKALAHLEELHRYTDSLMWPMSMPPKVLGDCSCLVADYGTSPSGLKKREYRKELCKRYGSHMQMISGVHYNFSLGEKADSETYLHLIRNVLRHGWILLYFFGASNEVDESFPRSSEISKFRDTATSIRMSSFGYQCRLQNAFPFDYNSLDGYLESMERALSHPVDEYASHTNHSLLQIENEHYALIRPKAGIDFEKSYHQAMQRKGIEYVELRALDLDPSSPIGVTKETLDFVSDFFFYCLEIESPPLEGTEHQENLEKVALFG